MGLPSLRLFKVMGTKAFLLRVKGLGHKSLGFRVYLAAEGSGKLRSGSVGGGYASSFGGDLGRQRFGEFLWP